MVWVGMPLDTISQTSVGIGNYATCRYTESLIPVTVENFSDVAALTLYMQIDTTQIEFLGLENINSVFSDGDFIANIEGQVLALTWFSLSAANLQEGVMCDIHVVLKGENADLEFLEGCELANSSLDVIGNVTYHSGAVLDLSSYGVYPFSQSLTSGETTTISVVDLPENVSCQWQVMESGSWENVDNNLLYNGVNTPELTISTVSLDLNDTYYRCSLTVDGCAVFTSSSELLVAPNGLLEILDANPIDVYPVPFVDGFTCLFKSPFKEVELKLTDVGGKVILCQRLENISVGQAVEFNTATWLKGMYLLSLVSDGKTLATRKLFHQ